MLLGECAGLGDEHDNLLSMIDGWSYDVLRFRTEQDEPDDFRDLWGIFDLIAAYYLRDRIERLVAEAGSSVPSVVTAVDELLKATFVIREFDWLARTSQQPGPGWWWAWLPSRGPLWKEVNEWDQPS